MAIQLLINLNFHTESVKNGTASVLVYLDFMKAFDSVPYSSSIFKLHNYGISCNLLL